MKIRTALFAATLCSAATFAAPVKFEIDPTHFYVQISASHLGFSHIPGLFKEVSGAYVYDSETGEIKDVHVVVKIPSLDTGFAERDEHLQKYLESAQFPEATFKSTGWKDGQLTGELTFHGKTQSITVPVSKNGEGKDPWGGYRSGFETAFTLKPADYGAVIEVAPEIAVKVSGEGIQAK
ncbi:MAG: YceI family protein [Cardiobacterium hominis]|jgi:proline--tRNA ligase|uniref:YceI family protein n=1 Tax=Cardiobacterium hominis TaxID=2718 RepID=UPI00066022B7|nr:YceI family protein [Cardiobacterium hominis]